MSRSRNLARSAGTALFENLEQRALMAGSTFVNFTTNYGVISIQLDDDTAPVTVANFLNYVNSDRLNSTFFHRRTNPVTEGISVVQGGGFRLDPLGSSVTTDAPIALESTGRLNRANTISMARQSAPDSATSQFFLNVADNPGLDVPVSQSDPRVSYAAFGEIVAGVDVLQTINALSTRNAGGAFTTLPVRDGFPQTGGTITAADLVQLIDATSSTAAELRVSAFTAGAAIRAGETVNVRWTVRNFGKTEVTQSWTDRIVLSANNIVGDADDITMGDFTVSGQSLAAGASLDREADVTVPLSNLLGTGNYNIFVITDVGNVVPEAVENNNATNPAQTVVSASAFAFAGTPQGAAASSTDENLVGAINAAGRAVVYSQVTTNGNTRWIVSDIQGAGPAPRREVEVWFDPTDGLAYAATPSATGLILYTRAANGAWTQRNLTTELTGAIINTEITVFQSRDATPSVHVAGLTQTGELVLYRENAAGTWEFFNVTTQDLTPQNFATPSWTGELTSYVTSWNAMNIVGLDNAGQVFTVWVAPGTFTQWRADNLSTITGAPAFTGGLTIFQTPWSAINIVGLDTSNNVSTTWWLPGGNWRTDNLTTAFNFPKLFGGRLASYVQPWGGQNIVGRTEDGNIAIYWWSAGINNDNWNYSASFVETSLRPAGRFTGVSSAGGSTTIVTTTENNRIYRYYWSPPSPATPWIAEDITTSASA